MDEASAPSTTQEEWRSFLFLAFIMALVLAVLVVGGYGFQLLTARLPTG